MNTNKHRLSALAVIAGLMFGSLAITNATADEITDPATTEQIAPETPIEESAPADPASEVDAQVPAEQAIVPDEQTAATETPAVEEAPAPETSTEPEPGIVQDPPIQPLAETFAEEPVVPPAQEAVTAVTTTTVKPSISYGARCFPDNRTVMGITVSVTNIDVVPVSINQVLNNPELAEADLPATDPGTAFESINLEPGASYSAYYPFPAGEFGLSPTDIIQVVSYYAGGEWFAYGAGSYQQEGCIYPDVVPADPTSSVKEGAGVGQAVIDYANAPSGTGESRENAELAFYVGDSTTPADTRSVPAGTSGSVTLEGVCAADGSPQTVTVVNTATGAPIATSGDLDFGCTVKGTPIIDVQPRFDSVDGGPFALIINLLNSETDSAGNPSTNQDVHFALNGEVVDVPPTQTLEPGNPVLNVVLNQDACSLADGSVYTVLDAAGNVIATLNVDELLAEQNIDCTGSGGGPVIIPATLSAEIRYDENGDLIVFLDSLDPANPGEEVPADAIITIEKDGQPYGVPFTLEGGSTIPAYFLYDLWCTTDELSFKIYGDGKLLTESGNIYDPANPLFYDCEDPGNGGGNGGGNGNSELCTETGAGWQPKVDVNGNHKTVTVNAPEGFLIDFTCVKAGTDAETLPVVPPASSVEISHSSGKDVSHYQVHLISVDDGGGSPGGGGTPGEENPDNGSPGDSGGNGPDKGGEKPDKGGDKPGKMNIAASNASDEIPALGLDVAGWLIIALSVIAIGLPLYLRDRQKRKSAEQS